MSQNMPVDQRRQSPSSSTSSKKHATATAAAAEEDKEFEPTVDDLLDEMAGDDEKTLEEEELLAAKENPKNVQEELSNLQKESEMPIEELLARYYGAREDEKMNESSSSNETSNGDGEPPDSQLKKLYPETFRNLSRPPSTETEDNDYSPGSPDDVKKTIMVGSDFQAVIPEDFTKYDDAPPYENEDKLLWDPSKVTEEQIIEYLKNSAQAVAASNAATLTGTAKALAAIPQGKHIRDDENLLFLLQQCGHNVDEALRRRRINAHQSPSDVMSLWSEEECRNFENGMRMYGKDFHQIRFKVRTRSVGELVQFYYLWKKTERHDLFANKARLDKKKYNLNPGLTDYMDRFLEDQDQSSSLNGQSRDRSSSPGVNSLLHADTKRQRLDKRSPDPTSFAAAAAANTTPTPTNTASSEETPEKSATNC